MRGACRNVALTCAYAVFANDSESCPENNADTCVESISEMFYQSLLCPDNSTYTKTAGTSGNNNYVNEHCKCNLGYSVSGSQCVVARCPENATKDSNGVCVCNTGYGILNSECVICPENSSINASGYCACNSGYYLVYDTCIYLCSGGEVFDEETNRCKCPEGTVSSGGTCMPSSIACPENAFVNDSGFCECGDGYTPKYGRFGNIESCEPEG